MDQEWREIEEFPGYLVSDQGLVQNSRGRIIARRLSKLGIAYVGLTKDNEQHVRGIARLVADTFLPPHENRFFDTPINLDGDRINNRLENLMWRPRWFAIKYHRQFHRRWAQVEDPIIEVEQELWFDRPLTAAVRFGLLALEVHTRAWNYSFHGNTYDTVWPTGQKFRIDIK